MNQEKGEGATPAKRPLLSPSASDNANGSEEQANRDARLVRMFCEGLMSYNILNDKSWQDFFKYEFPNYQMPSVKTFLEKLVPKQYEIEKNKLIKMLQSVKYLAVTINPWKIGVADRRRGQNLYTVTIHFIYGGKRINQCLFTIKTNTIRNDDNILTIFKSKLEEWKVFNKIVLCVAQRDITVRLTAWQINSHVCVASCIQDIMKPRFADIEQITEKKPEKNHKKKDPFSWHSQYLMLQNFTKNADIGPDDKKAFEECLNLLKPFEDLTKTLSSEQYQSLSYVIPSLVGLKTRLNECSTTTDRSSEWKVYFLKAVSSLLEETTASTKHMATFMDPRFKEACFVNPRQVDSVREEIINEIKEYQSSINDSHQVITGPDTPSTSSAPDPQRAVSVAETEDNGLLKYLDDKLQATVSANSLNTRFKVEQYIDLPHVSRGENPCQVWEQLKGISKYMELYDMSQKYLCMPATALPVETVSGEYIWNKDIKVDVYNDRKNEMRFEKITEILFLHSFYVRSSDNQTQ